MVPSSTAGSRPRADQLHRSRTKRPRTRCRAPIGCQFLPGGHPCAKFRVTSAHPTLLKMQGSPQMSIQGPWARVLACHNVLYFKIESQAALISSEARAVAAQAAMRVGLFESLVSHSLVSHRSNYPVATARDALQSSLACRRMSLCVIVCVRRRAPPTRRPLSQRPVPLPQAACTALAALARACGVDAVIRAASCRLPDELCSRLEKVSPLGRGADEAPFLVRRCRASHGSQRRRNHHLGPR